MRVGAVFSNGLDELGHLEFGCVIDASKLCKSGPEIVCLVWQLNVDKLVLNFHCSSMDTTSKNSTLLMWCDATLGHQRACSYWFHQAFQQAAGCTTKSSVDVEANAWFMCNKIIIILSNKTTNVLHLSINSMEHHSCFVQNSCTNSGTLKEIYLFLHIYRLFPFIHLNLLLLRIKKKRPHIISTAGAS